MQKKKIFVDMDGVLCEYYTAHKEALKLNPKQPFPQSQWGFFLNLKPMYRALESFSILSTMFDVWILTRPSPINVNCYTEKAEWVRKHLGYDVLEKTIFSCDKSLLRGEYLIDDQENANQLNFKGELIKFGSNKFPDWVSVVNYLVNKHHEVPIKDGLTEVKDFYLEEFGVRERVLNERKNKKH